MKRITELAVWVAAVVLLLGCRENTSPAIGLPDASAPADVSARSINGRVRLDATTHDGQAGVRFEPCSEGGTNAVEVEVGDWMEFSIDVSRGGLYAIDSRFANGGTNGAVAAIQSNGRVLSEFLLPPTGGWQNWTTARSVISLGSGLQRLRIECTKTGFNLNWIELDPVMRHSTR